MILDGVYTYDKLSEEAQENVKQWYLDDPDRVEFFYDDIVERLAYDYPNSELDVEFDLSYTQGDGLNIYGKFYMGDFLPYFKVSEDKKSLMKSYIDEISGYEDAWVKLSENRRYAYSMKFVDKEDTDWLTDELVNYLNDSGRFEIVDDGLIRDFYTQLFEYLGNLDKELERDGYEYLYEVSDEDMSDICDANGWLFDEDGTMVDSYIGEPELDEQLELPML